MTENHQLNPKMTSPPTHETTKARIITHMNLDHRPSLRLFARYYSHLPLSHAKTAVLIDITCSHLLLESSFGRTLVPFTPPLSSLSDSRGRLVEMHETCLRELQVDGVMVNRFTLPNRWWSVLLFVVCAWCFGTLPLRGLILPESGSVVSRVYSVNGHVPQLARLAYVLAPWTWCGMVIIHGLEARQMIRTRLWTYEVEVFSWVWWCWVGDAFIEGIGAFVRIDELAKEMKQKKEMPAGLAAKH